MNCGAERLSTEVTATDINENLKWLFSVDIIKNPTLRAHSAEKECCH